MQHMKRHAEQKHMKLLELRSYIESYSLSVE